MHSWVPQDGDSSFPGLAEQLNRDFQCGWCGFPASPYEGARVESNAAFLRDVPGLPSGWQFAIHHGCVNAVEEAMRTDTRWRERLWPHRVREKDGVP